MPPYEPEDDVITIDDYLNSLNLQQNPNSLGTQASANIDLSDWQSVTGQIPQAAEQTQNAALDFLGQLVWGGTSGLTWGASEFVQKSKPWEEMNDWERAGWVTGEGLSLFTPLVGPFALLGKGGQVATRALGGNRFIRKAASDLVKKEGLLAKQIVQEAADRGVMSQVVAKDLQKQFSTQLPKQLKDRYSVARLRDLTADTKTAHAASVGLRAQGEGIINKILTDSGVEASAGISRELAEGFVKQLEEGRYVNDIGEWVTRGFGGRNPGRVSEYIGMASQDFLYMGLHAVGAEKVRSMTNETDANYSEIPGHVLEMSLGFPLIRAIGKGGRESLARGIKDYFERYKKINYSKISKMPGGDKTARELLKSNVKGANLNIINSASNGEQFWKVGGIDYKGKADILNKVDDMELKDVVTLLNKMRLRNSQELVSKFNKNYFGDLLQSMPRMGTGILFMNWRPLKDGSFDAMSPQELSSHLFMGALMTKSKGAWDQAGKRGYLSDQYGEMRNALDFLQTDHTKMDQTIRAMTERDLIHRAGALYGSSPIAENVLNIFDSVFEGDKIDWRNTSGEHISRNKYGDVQELLASYNAMKKGKDMNYNLLDIGQINTNALDMLKRDLGSLKVADKFVSEIGIEDLSLMLSAETAKNIRSDYYEVFELLRERLDLPFSKQPAAYEGAPLTGTAYEIKGPEKINLPRIMEWNNLLKDHSSLLNIDVKSGTNVDVSAQRLADAMGMKLRDFDNAIGDITDQYMTNIASKYKNHNLYLPFDNNIFLHGLKVIRSNQAKDDVFKAATGIQSDSPNVKTLREAMINTLSVDGRFHKNIYKNEIDGELAQEATGDVAKNIDTIKPLYDLTRILSDRGPSQVPKRNITPGEVKELAEKITELTGRLPADWQGSQLYEKGYDLFKERIISDGNPLSFSAFTRARDKNLIFADFQNGIQKIIFPKESAIDNHFKGDTATATEVKRAVKGVKDLFNPRLVSEDAVIPGEANLLDWINIHKDIGHSKVKDFVEKMPEILENLGKDSMVVTQIRSVKDLTQKIKDELTKPSATPDTEAIEKMIAESKVIHKALISEGNISEVTNKKMGGLITALEMGYDEMIGGGLPPLESQKFSGENYERMVRSIDEMIVREIEADHVSKTELARLMIKIENHITQRDPNLSPSEGQDLLENLSHRFHKLLGNKLSQEVPVQELIDTFNNTRNWGDARSAIDAVVKMSQLANPHQEAFNKSAEKILNELQNEKLHHERPINYQELLTKYPSIQDSSDPNKVNHRFISQMVNAFDPYMSIQPKEVLEDFIYKDIRKKFPDSAAQRTEIDKFDLNEMEPLLQNLFGSTRVRVLSLDGNKIEYDEKPSRHSLSTMTLDRMNTADPDFKYDYALLEGSMKIRDRVINMDDSFEIGGDWITMQNILDKGIPIDVSKMRDLYEELRNINFEMQVKNLDNIQPVEESNKVYMRLSPKMRILFPKSKENVDLLNRDFDAMYVEKENQYTGTDNAKRLNALKTGFSEYFNTTSQDNDIMRLKMLFVHYNRTMGPEFDKMMNRMDQDRNKIEFNSFKRGFIADGGTTTILTKEALEWGARYGANRDIQDTNQRILDEGIKLGVLKDEVADIAIDNFFNNKKAVERQMITRRDAIADPNSQEHKIINKHLERVTGGEYKSLDSFFLDGGKFASEDFAKVVSPKKGGSDWNGFKTNIMSNDILGKGFTIYHPEIAKILKDRGIDLLVGETVAKTLNERLVTPFEIDPAAPLERGWETRLSGMSDINTLTIPHDKFGISWTTHSDAGINYSSSMFDFQNIHHLNRATELYKIDSIIEKMGRGVNNTKNFGNGDLLRALYQMKQQESGMQFTTDNYTLTEKMVEWGARESNPLVQRDLVRLLQSDFYKILTKRPTQHGEEGISAPDINNELSNPVYARIENIPVVGKDGTTIKQVNSNHAYQFGGGSITSAMSRVKIDRDVVTGENSIDNIPFIARDPKTGLDIMFSFSVKDGKTVLEHYSPMLNAQESLKGKKEDVANIQGLAKGERIVIGKDTIAEVTEVLNKLKDTVSETKNVRYGDLTRFLEEITPFDRLKRINETAPIGMGKDFVDLSKKYYIQLGMVANAIPKVLKDQPLLRIEQVLGGDLNGLATINPYDLRVTMQRDHDGDHIYKYLKMPMEMLKDYTDDMGDITDYREMDNLEYPKEINMFGFNGDGVAGKDIQAVGFDRIGHIVAKKRRIISSVISRKGTLSYLLNSELNLDGESFVGKEFNSKNIAAAKSKAVDIFQRSGDFFQAALDFWKAAPKISENLEAAGDYFVFGDHTNYKDPSSRHSKESFLKDGFGVTEFERGLFQIMHRTLVKARIMDNEVHDATGKRQPTTAELRRAQKKIVRFFDNPDLFLIRESLDKARIERRTGNESEAKQIVKNVIDFFYKDLPVGSGQISKVRKQLQKGNVPFETMTRRFSLNKDKSLGIRSSISGHILDKAIKNSLFWEYDNKDSYNKNRTMFEHFNNLQGKIEIMQAMGPITPEMIDNMILESKAFTEIVNTEPVFKANLSGILSTLANSQHARSLESLRMLNNESFPDKNKIARAEDRVENMRLVVDALDRQMARDMVLRKDDDVIFKRIPKATDDNLWTMVDLKFDGNLYRVKGDVGIKELNPRTSLQSIQYMQPVRKGKKVSLEKGYTYLVDIKPPKFLSADDVEVKWNRAFRSATQVDILKAGDVDPMYNPDINGIGYNKFRADVDKLRRGVNDSFSKAKTKADENLIDKGHIYFYNSVITDRMIGEFFNNHSSPQNFERLLRFLLQPQIQRNVYVKEGDMEVPYYKMNNRLIESVFNWMRRPATEGNKSNAEQFGFNPELIIKDLINDMNAFHDNRLGDVEFRAQQYNRMRMPGKEDFNRLRETTTDIMLKDWYHNPVLSKYSRDFFLGRGDIVRRRDIDGRGQYFYDYRKSGKTEPYELIRKMGCK